MIFDHILYAEDEDNHVFFLKRAFRLAGLDCPLFVATDGEMAKEYLDGAGPYGERTAYPLPSLILLDVNLPRLSGLELLSWIRTHPLLHATTVIMLTSSTHYDDVSAAYRLGANGYVVKSAVGNGLVSFAEALKEILAKKVTGGGWLKFSANHPAPEHTGEMMEFFPPLSRTRMSNS